MPDWNPAEIIGTNPRKLASSLYQNQITDHIWSEARKIMGYKDVGKTPLMYFLGINLTLMLEKVSILFTRWFR